MSTGYNTNISYRGKVYHVQSEDSGPQNPVIYTHIFTAGKAVFSERSEYRELVGLPDVFERAKALMIEQHKRIEANLLSGQYDDALRGYGHANSSIPLARSKGRRMGVTIDESPLSQSSFSTIDGGDMSGSFTTSQENSLPQYESPLRVRETLHRQTEGFPPIRTGARRDGEITSPGYSSDAEYRAGAKSGLSGEDARPNSVLAGDDSQEMAGAVRPVLNPAASFSTLRATGSLPRVLPANECTPLPSSPTPPPSMATPAAPVAPAPVAPAISAPTPRPYVRRATGTLSTAMFAAVQKQQVPASGSLNPSGIAHVPREAYFRTSKPVDSLFDSLLLAHLVEFDEL